MWVWGALRARPWVAPPLTSQQPGGRCLLWPSVDNTSTNDDSDNRHHLKQPPLCQARLSPAHDCVGLIFQAKWVVAG